MRWSKQSWQLTPRRPKSKSKTLSCWTTKHWLSSRESASLFSRNSGSSGRRTPRIKQYWWASSKPGWRITKKRLTRQDTRCQRLPTKIAKEVCRSKWWRPRSKHLRTWSRVSRASLRRPLQQEMHPWQKQLSLNWCPMSNWSVWMNSRRNFPFLRNKLLNRQTK